MAAQSSTTAVYRHVLGDLVVRYFTLATVADNDTLTVTSNPYMVDIMPSASASAANNPCASWSGNVITFHSGGAWSGTVAVYSRS